jgi:DNA-binding MarR family transcriptional regulator
MNLLVGSNVRREIEEAPITSGVSSVLRRAHRAVHGVVADKLSRAGIAMRHFHVLRSLLQEDGITQIQLCGRVGFERGTVSLILDEMEGIGLVRRVRRTDDRRKIDVFLTPKGRRTRDALVGSIDAVQAIALQGLSDEEHEHFKRAVATIVANCDAYLTMEPQRVAS